jgi:hypothetical protein
LNVHSVLVKNLTPNVFTGHFVDVLGKKIWEKMKIYREKIYPTAESHSLGACWARNVHDSLF